MSQISAHADTKSNAAQHHWLAERLLDRTPMAITHLRPTFFAEWLDWYWASDGTKGIIRLPMGTGSHAPIAGEDQVQVAAILADPQPNAHQTCPLFGPVKMDSDEIAEALSSSLGMPVHYEPNGIAEYRAELTAPGFPAYRVQNLAYFVQGYQDSVFAGTNRNAA